jgi:hypothetical protein
MQALPMTFKTAKERYVVNFRQLSAVKISERLDVMPRDVVTGELMSACR